MSENAMDFEVISSIDSSMYVPTSFLEKEFYSGTRSGLTYEKLMELSMLARSIREPSPYGTFEDDMHYLQTLELALNSTAETRHCGAFFLKKVFPNMLYKDAFLDVGPGNGQLTKWLGSKFKHITAVDINKEIIDKIDVEYKVSKRGTELNKICGSILDVELSANYYDFALLSHVLYYLDKNTWLDAVERVFQALKPQGIMAIVLSGNQAGKGKLIEHFKGKFFNLDAFIEKCAGKFGCSNIKVFASNEGFYALDIKTMLHIAGFFLRDSQISVNKEQLTEYLNKNHYKPGRYYEITTRQSFILIRKN